MASTIVNSLFVFTILLGLGFLADLVPLLLPGLGFFIGLYAFTNIMSALIFISALAFLTFLGLRFYEKHHHGEDDDRLTDARMMEAQEYIVRRWREKNCGS